MATAIIFTKVSATRVKVDNNGRTIGFSPQVMNIFEHPTEDAIIITTSGSAEHYLAVLKSGLTFKASDVTVPANTGKNDLANKLIATIFS